MFSLLYFTLILFIIIINILLPNLLFRRKIEKKIMTNGVAKYTCYNNILFVLEESKMRLNLYYYTNLKNTCQFDDGGMKIRCTGKDFYFTKNNCAKFLNHLIMKSDFTNLYN